MYFRCYICELIHTPLGSTHPHKSFKRGAELVWIFTLTPPMTLLGGCLKRVKGFGYPGRGLCTPPHPCTPLFPIHISSDTITCKKVISYTKKTIFRTNYLYTVFAIIPIDLVGSFVKPPSKKKFVCLSVHQSAPAAANTFCKKKRSLMLRL